MEEIWEDGAPDVTILAAPFFLSHPSALQRNVSVLCELISEGKVLEALAMIRPGGVNLEGEFKAECLEIPLLPSPLEAILEVTSRRFFCQCVMDLCFLLLCEENVKKT